MMRLTEWIPVWVVVGSLAVGAPLPSQGAGAPPPDAATRLREVLPPDVAVRVLAVVASARDSGLDASALEQRALKFAARGIPAADIERSVEQQALLQARARALLVAARGTPASHEEIAAGAEAMREGVSGEDVSSLAKGAPSGRSLAVPLYVIGSLAARGLPSDAALERVLARLRARASDADLEGMSQDANAGGAGNGSPGSYGRDLSATKRPASAPGQSGATPGGPPPGVPANGAARSHPQGPPSRPPGRP